MTFPIYGKIKMFQSPTSHVRTVRIFQSTTLGKIHYKRKIHYKWSKYHEPWLPQPLIKEAPSRQLPQLSWLSPAGENPAQRLPLWIGKPWENRGKTWENHGKTMGKWWFDGIWWDLMGIYPLGLTNSLLLKMVIQIVSFPIKHGDVPYDSR